MEKKSSFQFKGYKVTNSLIQINGEQSEELTLQFNPKGILNNSSNIFYLELIVLIFDKQKNINIDVTFEGEFFVSERDENLKQFLFTNAPAILFPYVRAYISTLTSLSGIPAVLLPTMNLQSLKEKIDQNFTEIN